jgi:hypothetical protein
VSISFLNERNATNGYPWLPINLLTTSIVGVRPKKWDRIIDDLRDRGWSQMALATHLSRRGTPVTPSALSQLRTGLISQPNYPLGCALVDLHESGKTRRPARRANGAA